MDAYNTGHYKDAEAQAQRFIDSNAKSTNPVTRKKSVEAWDILAFSAARRKDLRLTRERFAVLEAKASKLPDKGKPAVMPGQFKPTLTEEGAYQHAICTAALGEQKAAEANTLRFFSVIFPPPCCQSEVYPNLVSGRSWFLNAIGVRAPFLDNMRSW